MARARVDWATEADSRYVDGEESDLSWSRRVLQEVLDSTRSYELWVVSFTLHGPGGGWPSVEVEGPREEVLRWLREEYDPDSDDHYLVEEATSG